MGSPAIVLLLGRLLRQESASASGGADGPGKGAGKDHCQPAMLSVSS